MGPFFFCRGSNMLFVEELMFFHKELDTRHSSVYDPQSKTGGYYAQVAVAVKSRVLEPEASEGRVP
jgi:hypothetical protein